MKSQFNYFMPTRILFGPGKLKKLATTPFLPGKKALIVTSSGPSVKKYGYLDRVIEYLKQNNVSSVTFDKILPNPILDHVMEGAQAAKDNQCDFVVGLGGGSSIDSAKSIAVMAKNPGNYWDYVYGGTGKGKPVTGGALPIVAITTTAGTGTEADPWTVITNPQTNEKIGFGNDYTFPVLSIVDPELMVTVPPKFTAFQGMDAFFHSVEGYLATVSQPASDQYALEAVTLITKYLPVAVADGSNLEARTALAWANTEAGMVESLSSCISHHSLEHALSAYHPGLPHGAGLVLLSIAYFSFMAGKSPARFANLAKAMGKNVIDLPQEQQPFAFIAALKKLIAAIGLQDLKLSDYGVKKEEAPLLARNAMSAMGGLFAVDPYKLSPEEVTGIFEACLE
ncbi:alcohol dehydrogenase iron-type [Lucifera butyrica]|uniref:Alcohol dehydrogenase iron-type n=1 Tax=Lucifera butyrica TaxID=1351585 RepID=A0A498R743_9FIRM|nr:iron-containing alcohol dehydrogenase [Lucifera butyrica]VBB07019.1 alcohol dehydrogenase iron-type [Lucifera butyrica]